LITYVWTGDILKPTVVHRDVNSRNILVKADLSLCLCDFGFAMKIATSRLTQTNDEHSSLADVSCCLFLTFCHFVMKVRLLTLLCYATCYISISFLWLVIIVVVVVVVVTAPAWTSLHGDSCITIQYNTIQYNYL